MKPHILQVYVDKFYVKTDLYNINDAAYCHMGEHGLVRLDFEP